jgi:hypothetical protein
VPVLSSTPPGAEVTGILAFILTLMVLAVPILALVVLVIVVVIFVNVAVVIATVIPFVFSLSGNLLFWAVARADLPYAIFVIGMLVAVREWMVGVR